MAFDSDNPKLTAYALGELDEAQRAEIEAWLESDPGARRVVEEIKSTVESLQDGLSRETVSSAGPEIAFSAMPAMTSLRWRHAIRRGATIALAASFVVAIGLLAIYLSVSVQYRGREVALTPTQPRITPPAVIASNDAKQKVPYNDILRYPSNWPELYSRSRVVATEQSEKSLTLPSAIQAPFDANEGTLLPVEQSALTQTGGQHANPSVAVDKWSDAQFRSALGREALEAKMRERSVALERGESGEEVAVASQLNRRLPDVRLDNSSLGDVVDFLRDVSGASIFVDWKGLQQVGVHRDTPVSLRLSDVKFSDALRRVLDSVQRPGSPIYISVEEGVITVSPRQSMHRFNTESYDRIIDNPFLDAAQNPLSTFSIDVDTASYSNIRRFLNQGQLPPKDAVRIEEMVNYFTYDYPAPQGEAPFSSSIEIAACPWNSQHRLVRIGLKGKQIATDERGPTNLVFLIDVSGSMRPANKLPLLKRAMAMLVNQLTENDRVAMVVYAGSSGLVLPSTSCEENGSILNALDQLEAGGSTNGGEGIELAYQIAAQNFIKGGINRVILCTDGDFNVGVTDQGSLTRLIEERATTGVFLSVLGFGMGNVKDSTMEKLADKGNGNYAYIDTLNEARKVLVEQMNGTLVTIAKDVKIQVEFNPAQVQAYRLIGYENRMLAKEDFNDDTKDAGEIGAGHTVTALYEVVPAGAESPAATTPPVDPLKYQKQTAPTVAAQSGEMLTLKLRYKQPDGDVSKLLEFPVKDEGRAFARASQDFKFAAAVAGFGMILRDSPHKGQITLDGVIELAQESKGPDASGYRGEFIELVRQAKALAK